MCTQATTYFPSLRAVVCIGDGIYACMKSIWLVAVFFFLKKSFASCSLYSASYLPCLQTVHPIVHAVSYFLRGMQGDLENICHCLEHTEWLAYFSHNSEVPALKLSSGLFVHGAHMQVSFKQDSKLSSYMTGCLCICGFSGIRDNYYAHLLCLTTITQIIIINVFCVHVHADGFRRFCV